MFITETILLTTMTDEESELLQLQRLYYNTNSELNQGHMTDTMNINAH